MQTRIKATAVLLAVIVSVSGLLRSSAPVTIPDTQVMAPPIQATPPTTSAATQPPAPSGTPSPPVTTAPSATQPSANPTEPPAAIPPASEPLNQTPEPEASGFTASHAFVYRCASQTFDYLKGTLNERIYPASITKLFTAYVALLYLQPGEPITVDDAILSTPYDSSFAHISVGDVLTAGQLVYGMLLASGGDAARMIAAAAGRVITGDPELSGNDAIAVFMTEMNRQAVLLGMPDSHFVTPDGYHDVNHYTSMADLITLGMLCLNTDVIRQAAAATEYTLTLSGQETTWKNTNMLLHKDSQFSQFYRDGAVGLKTGFTVAAGRCLLSAFLVDGEYILTGVFGCPDPDSSFIPQFVSTCYLYDTYIAP